MQVSDLSKSGTIMGLKTLNASQKAALDIKTNTALTAAAGSGKTTVLVGRFLKILEHNNFRPEEIVAITFTDEAARQMREKIRLGIIERQLTTVMAEEEKNGWGRALSHLPFSEINTIHGFCLDLLREFGFRVGLNPDFKILDSSPQRVELEKSIHNILAKLSRSHDPDLKVILNYLPVRSVPTLFRELAHRRAHLKLNQLIDADSLRPIFRLEACAFLCQLPDWEELREILLSIPKPLLNESGPLGQHCRHQLQILKEKPTTDPDVFIEAFRDILKGSTPKPTKEWKDTPCCTDLFQKWKFLKLQIQKEFSIASCSEVETNHFTTAQKSIRNIYTQITRHFQTSKKENQTLDFDDLLVLATRLGRDNWVVEKVCERFRFYLVDEFQDTNSLQWQLLEPFVQKSNILVVGDSKQSIYRFRHADIGVFERVQKWIGESGQVLEMPQNYRSAPSLVNFCNSVFRKLMVRHVAYESKHQEMEPARETSSVGSVESCFYESEEAWGSPRDPSIVSANIHRIKAEGFQFGDIAILLRARTHLQAYENSLRAGGIPFQTIGGAGFLNRQEVLDVLNLLRFLADTDNDIALIGILRSPFFNFSDEDLYHLSIRPGGHWWDKLKTATSESRLNHWDFAHSCLKDWLTKPTGMLTSRIVEEALIHSGYFLILESSSRTVQTQRNLLKIIRIIQKFEIETPSNIRVIVRFLEELIRSDSNEPEETAFRPEEDAVRVYTIHGAKGLQFPVVILPGLGSPLNLSRNNRLVVEDIDWGGQLQSQIGFKIWNPSKGHKDFRHPVCRMLRRLNHYRTIAEEKRLLYVALTRAEDRLVLVGKKTDRVSYYRWLAPSTTPELSVPITDEKDLDWKGAPEQSSTSSMTVKEVKEPQNDSPSSGTASTTNRFQQSPTGNPRSSNIHWSPTKIVNFQKCPRKFFLSTLSLLPEEESIQYLPTKSDKALLGEIVHSLLERVPNLSDEQSLLKHCRTWESSVEMTSGEKISEFFATALAHVKSVASSRFQTEMEHSIALFSEKRLNLKFAGKRISGIIDRLYQRPDGSWVVMDFKTHSSGADTGESLENRESRLQVELYLWAISRILETDQLSGVLFFTSTGETMLIPYDSNVKERCEQLVNQLPILGQLESYPLTTRPQLCRSCGYRKQKLCEGVLPDEEQQE